MREVFIHQDSARVGLYKSVLDSAGIPNFVRNALTNNSVTDMPSPIFFPALCVMHDEDYDAAIELLRKVVKPEPADGPDWKCPSCGEEVPATFDTCWKCNTEREPGQAGAPVASPPSVSVAPAAIAAPSAEADARKIANLFRWLLIVAFLWEIGWAFILPAMGVHAVLEPPAAVQAYFDAHGPSPSMQGLSRMVHYYYWAIALVGMLLCFCFSRYGRVMYVLLMVLDIPRFLGLSHGVSPRGLAVAAHFHVLLLGVLLAMMYLPPLAGAFSRKS